MVTTDALKLLYKKLGGTANVDNITAISDMVDLIEDVAGGGGGGASGLVVNVLTNEQDKMYLDKNYTEITTALNNGIMPLICTDQSDEVVTLKTYPFILYGTVSGNTPSGMVYQVVLRMYNNLNNAIEFSSSTADGVLTEADGDSNGN